MKRWRLMGFSLATLLGAALAVNANVGPPRPPQPGPGGPGFGPPGLAGLVPQNAKFVVEVDENAKQARLVIPLTLLMKGMGGRPGLGPLPPVGRPGQPVPVPPPKAPPNGPGANAGPVGLPTLVAGLALTAALVSGGFWLLRRGSSRTLIGILVFGVFAIGATALWADLAPGGRPRPRPEPRTTPVTLPAGIELSDHVLLELAPTGDAVRLIVPKDAVLKKAESKE